MTLSEMRHLLATHDLQLTRSLGQTFLHDGNQARRLVTQAQVQPTDRVLEIGPGLGPLTELLIESAGKVVAIETDARLFAILQERFAHHPKLELVHADALVQLRAAPSAWGGWKLVANLPYSVASPILVELALAPDTPERCVVTVQLEVAQRLTAPPGGKDYGILTLLVQQRFECTGWFRIPSTCFFPAPSIDSACIVLRQRPTELLTSDQRAVFARIVRRAFSERRKMMFKRLKLDWPEDALRANLEAENIPLDTRAERVSLDQFVALARRLSGHGESHPVAPSHNNGRSENHRRR